MGYLGSRDGEEAGNSATFTGSLGVVAAGLIVIGTFVVASFGILGLAASIIDILNPESWPLGQH